MIRTIVIVALAALSFAPLESRAQSTDDYVQQRLSDLSELEFEHKMISSGKNFPSVNVRAQNRPEIMVAVAEGIPIPSLAEYLAVTDEEIQSRLDVLVDAGLVVKQDDTYDIGIALMTVDRVSRYMPVSDEIVTNCVSILKMALPTVMGMYDRMDAFVDLPFHETSLSIVSDVLLDNWQINAVEKQFLDADRPLRDETRYYYSLQEKPSWQKQEAFGIYGNQYKGFGAATVGVYGNQRSNNPYNFASINREQIRELFLMPVDTVSVFKAEVISHYVGFARTKKPIPSEFQQGLEELGWLRGGKAAIPVLTKDENQLLTEMASLVTADLIKLFESERPVLTKQYEESPYRDEISFEEYFMWWFHLFYSSVTDRMILDGYISIPESGISTFIIAD